MATRCPLCGIDLPSPQEHVVHVRWLFDQGDPIAFARFALNTSPYVPSLGARPTRIPKEWWEEHGDWVVDRVLYRFEAMDGCVFGELAQLDLLARDIWKEFVEGAHRRAGIDAPA